MSWLSEQGLRDGFDSFKRNILAVTRITCWFTIIVLFGISIGMLSNKRYPLLAVYAMFTSIMVLMIEGGISVILKIDSSSQPGFTSIKEKLSFVDDALTPIKKCILYAVLALPLFIHMTVAVLGALLLFLCAIFLAGQVKYEDGRYHTVADDGLLGGVSSGDITIPSQQAPQTQYTQQAPQTHYTTPAKPAAGPLQTEIPTFTPGPLQREESPKSDAEWDLVKDENLLLG